MRQTSVLTQPSTSSPVSTCANCPLFRDLEDSRGRGWCDTFDRVTRRHHKATDSCHLALKALLDKQPVPVKVQLDSKELEEEEEYPLPLHSFVADVCVSKPTEPYVKAAVEQLGFSESYETIAGKLSDAPIVEIDRDYRIRANRLGLYTLASSITGVLSGVNGCGVGDGVTVFDLGAGSHALLIELVD